MLVKIVHTLKWQLVSINQPSKNLGVSRLYSSHDYISIKQTKRKTIGMSAVLGSEDKRQVAGFEKTSQRKLPPATIHPNLVLNKRGFPLPSDMISHAITI